MKKVIAVIGGGVNCSAEILKCAEKVGALVAEKGGILICGGLGGVMEAACKGAHKKGGTAIGVLPGQDTSEANPYVDIPIATGMGEARNIVIIRSADAIIAIDGGFGTLTEVAFSLKFDKTIISLQSWEVDPAIMKAKSAEEAVALAFGSIRK